MALIGIEVVSSLKESLPVVIMGSVVVLRVVNDELFLMACNMER